MAEKSATFFEKAGLWLKNSITVRIATIGILILLLLIPVSMVESLIRERENTQSEAIREVSAKWGEDQTITGLVLTVPYTAYTKVFDEQNKDKFQLVESREYAHFLPEKLTVTGVVSPELRYRGIYEVIVYTSQLNVSGSFTPPSFDEWKIRTEDVIWEDAFVSLGLSDLRGIQQNVSVQWNNQTYAFNPGIESTDVIGNGISTRIRSLRTDTVSGQHTFSLKLNFNGSSTLNFVPLGKETSVSVQSPWKNPSFDGAFLPDKREITPDGFSATWDVLHLNRPYPQRFRGEAKGIYESAFGVNLIVPVDEYQKSMRSAKYAVMFITLTFLILFFIQILNRVRIHPIQYIIVGLSLCVFYTLLIALSEHISFGFSYLISSVAIVGLITLYVKSIFNRTTLTVLIGSILTILYLFIYSIIQLEDYALLMGSLGLFIVLAIVMYMSRKIDWYSVQTTGEPG